jgi:hypothetical protein
MEKNLTEMTNSTNPLNIKVYFGKNIKDTVVDVTQEFTISKADLEKMTVLKDDRQKIIETDIHSKECDS